MTRSSRAQRGLGVAGGPSDRRGEEALNNPSATAWECPLNGKVTAFEAEYSKVTTLHVADGGPQPRRSWVAIYTSTLHSPRL